MMIKARDLKVGQWIKVFRKWETISEIQEYETGVMVFYASQVDNPFLSSRYGSYNFNTLVEVDGYLE